MAQETLDFRREGISPSLWLLIPTFSLVYTPRRVTPAASARYTTLSYHVANFTEVSIRLGFKHIELMSPKGIEPLTSRLRSGALPTELRRHTGCTMRESNPRPSQTIRRNTGLNATVTQRPGRTLPHRSEFVSTYLTTDDAFAILSLFELRCSTTELIVHGNHLNLCEVDNIRNFGTMFEPRYIVGAESLD